MDTLCLTRDAALNLELPPFQRPLRVNDKVRIVSQYMKANGGVIDGVITIGVLNSKRYLVDGQHRIHGFLLSELPEAYVDVRVCEFETMAEMAAEYVKLNSQIVRMRPDDILRGLESSIKGLQILRKECPFIGYDQIRRRPGCPLISMSFAIRAWGGASREVPTGSGLGSAAQMAQEFSEEKAKAASTFFNMVQEAWGEDLEYQKLWGGLNITLCGWLWNQTVIGQYSLNCTSFKPDEFKQGMTALSANAKYMDWLVGRENTERDRAPAYNRIKSIMTHKLEPLMGRKLRYPGPPWAYHGTKY